MVSHQKQVAEARSSERIPLQCFIVFASGSQVDEGRVLNLSEHGCLVESILSVKAGDSLQLRLSLPSPEPSMRVSWAVVRWVKGSQFGLEFIEMGAKEQVRLNQFVAMHGDPWASSHD